MIKLGKDSLEISHSRYLSDSSTGLLFYVNIIILNKCGILNLDFLSNVIDKNFLMIDVFLVILLFFLATTVGMLISVFSWFSFEYLYVKWFEKLWWKFRFPLKFIQFGAIFQDIINRNEINYSNWHSSIIIAEENLLLKKVSISRFILQRSIRVLIRNLAFIIFIDSLIILFVSPNWAILLLLLVVTVLLAISGMIGFFGNVGLIVKHEIEKTKA